MKILLIADLHSVRYDAWQKFLSIDKDSFDVIATLGDIHGIYLRQLRDTFIDKKIFGVLGNHDEKGKFAYYDIDDIHGKVINVNGIKIVGVEGSVRYKDNEKYPLYTQFEIIQICNNLDYVDIVFSHNSPYGIHDSSNSDGDIAHLGFQGLLSYIENKKPKYCIHGHQHINQLTKFEDVNVLGVHGILILELETGELTRII